MLAEDIKEEFTRRIFEESYPRIIHCLSIVDEKQVWLRPNKNSNSIGNLILHLLGNMRQWMCASFNAAEDNRKRSLEFETSESRTKGELIEAMQELQEEVKQVLTIIDKEALLKEYKVQVYKEKGVSIIIHVIEHFSYHTGQIALLTKLFADKDLEFYPYSLE